MRIIRRPVFRGQVVHCHHHLDSPIIILRSRQFWLRRNNFRETKFRRHLIFDPTSEDYHLPARTFMRRLSTGA